jgi:isopentenyl diphosphate isomerase/L-lactate dehydrogenase-like FMN-dependent dehydrogenase
MNTVNRRVGETFLTPVCGTKFIESTPFEISKIKDGKSITESWGERFEDIGVNDNFDIANASDENRA